MLVVVSWYESSCLISTLYFIQENAYCKVTVQQVRQGDIHASVKEHLLAHPVDQLERYRFIKLTVHVSDDD